MIPRIHQVLKSHGQDYLVGNRLSRADIHLVELLYYVEEVDPSLLANFPLVKVISLTAFRRKGLLLPSSHLHLGSIVVQDLAVPMSPALPPRCWLRHAENAKDIVLVMPRTFELDASPRRTHCLYHEKDLGLSISLPIPIALWHLSLVSPGFPLSTCVLLFPSCICLSKSPAF